MLKTIYNRTLGALFKLIYDRLIKPIYNIEDSPHSIALGVTLGLWIALTPTVGIQMTIAVILCTLFKANVLVAVAMCWISNPVTFIPMYYGYYKFGLVVLQQDDISPREFKQLVKNDYVLVGMSSAPSEVLAHRSVKEVLHQIKNVDRQPSLYYNRSEESIVEIIQDLCRQADIEFNDTWTQAVDSDDEIADNIEKFSAYGIMDQLTCYRIKKRRHLDVPDPPTEPSIGKAKNHFLVVAQPIPRGRGWWESTQNVIALSLQEFAIPMWIGSLIIATVLAIPAYPLTKGAIIRFRSSYEKIKEVRERTRRMKGQKKQKKQKKKQREGSS